jgi:hypothetical protein
MRHVIMNRIAWVISFIVLGTCALFGYVVSNR